MKLPSTMLIHALLLGFCAISFSATSSPAQVATAPSHNAPAILNREQASAILPPSVFYRGQSAPIQGRNSAGIKLDGDKLVLFTLVDTSGYSTSIQQSYQAYLLTEVPLTFGGQKLQPGSYGFGFIAGDKVVLMDIGGNEIMRSETVRDAELKRPNPLQILPDKAPDSRFRLYLGRSYVVFSPAAK